MDTKINYDTTLTDSITGECIEIEKGTKIVSPQRQEQIKEYAQKAARTSKVKNELYKDTNRLRGDFYSVLCRDVDLLWDDISEPTLGKLIYLATFIDNNNCICFDGNWEKEISSDNHGYNHIEYIRNGIPMKKEDIRMTLNINRKSFSFFWKECIAKQLIIESNGSFFLPRNKFRFCDDSGVNKRKVPMIKMFKHAIRYMYEHTDERSRKTLVHLYRLIPFINLTYNGLCENPFEMDKSKIKPLRLSKICEKFGIDKTNQVRFLNKLKKLRFIDKEGKECSVIRYEWLYYDEDIYWIKINPQFYSGYVSEEAMVEMVEQFRLDCQENFSETLDK